MYTSQQTTQYIQYDLHVRKLYEVLSITDYATCTNTTYIQSTCGS